MHKISVFPAPKVSGRPSGLPGQGLCNAHNSQWKAELNIDNSTNFMYNVFNRYHMMEVT